MDTVSSLAKKIHGIGAKAFVKHSGIECRPWDLQQAHAVEAYRAVARWHLSRLKTVERRSTADNKRVTKRSSAS